VEGLQNVQAGVVRRIAKRYAQQGQAQRIATIDQDATIIESHKEAAYGHYEGGRGYQPMVAVWAVFELPTQATAAVALGRGKGVRGG